MYPQVTKDQAVQAATELVAIFREGRATSDPLGVVQGMMWLSLFASQYAAEGQHVFGADSEDDSELRALSMTLELLAYELDPTFSMPVGGAGEILTNILLQRILVLLKNFIAEQGIEKLIDFIINAIVV